MDQKAPDCGGPKAGTVVDVQNGMRALLGLVPLYHLEGSVNVLTMQPDGCDWGAHSPKSIRGQHLGVLDTLVGEKNFSTIEVPRTDFYRLATESCIRQEYGIPLGVAVRSVRSYDTRPYGNLGLLVAPKQSDLLKSLPELLPTTLIGHMSASGHQNSILVLNQKEFQDLQLLSEILASKEIFQIPDTSTRQVLDSILKLWDPDPSRYEVSEGSAPKASVAVVEGDSSGLLGRLTEEYGACAGVFSKVELPRYLGNVLCKGVVVVNEGPTVMVRNGVTEGF
jgi:hypothetical protein